MIFKGPLFITLLNIFNIALIIIAFTIIGTPLDQKSIALDKQRISALHNINSSISSYAYTNGLPNSLEEITSLNSSYYKQSLRDPETMAPYEYKALSATSYQLCADFSTDGSKLDEYTLEYLPQDQKTFTKGYHCFKYQIQTRTPSSLNSGINPSVRVSPSPTRSPTPIPIPSIAVLPTVTPESIGLTLTKIEDGHKINLKVTNTSGITRIDYDLYYHAVVSGKTVLRNSRGSYYNTQGQVFDNQFILGHCGTICTYDEGVSDIYVSLVISKTDGRSYQVQKALNN